MEETEMLHSSMMPGDGVSALLDASACLPDSQMRIYRNYVVNRTGMQGEVSPFEWVRRLT